jgi:beta-glucosidase
MIDETSLSARVDELIAAMTPAEKAGQLTQYFYFGRAVETIDLPDVEGVPANPSSAVEAALGRGESAHCCSSLIRPRRTGSSG